MKNITVVGLGYVGLSNALLLAKKHNVVGIDIVSDRVKLLNNKICPLKDDELEMALKEDRNITFTTSTASFKTSDYIILALPTNYDETTNYFDTKALDSTISNILKIGNPKGIIIKSTIPIFYTQKMREKTKFNGIVFVPEFLREGTAYKDSEYPNRIIVGDKSQLGKDIMHLYSSCCLGTYDELFMGSSEAEAVKLFSNAYLAMRVAYFNELDIFAESNMLNTKDIIEGVSADRRIGNFYNNPSFGYGGYCFPKDTKQLLANFRGIPNSLIQAIVTSNDVRKQYITNKIDNKYKTVGIYKLAMKAKSDNCRQSAIIDIANSLCDKGVNVIVYDNSVDPNILPQCTFVTDLNEFVETCDVIIANRLDNELTALNVCDKIYTRDCFGGDF